MSLRRFTPIIPLLSLAVLLEIVVVAGIVPSYLLPSTSQIFKSMWSDWSVFSGAVTSTFLTSLFGLLVSFFVGLGLALVFQLLPWAQQAVYPYTILFQTVPIIAIAPLLVIWFGFGFYTVMISAFIVSVFPVLANSMFGLSQVDKGLVELFKLYRAPKMKEVFLLRLPWAWPSVLNGLRIAAGLAVIGSIVGEFIAGGGLGGLIDTARTQQRVDIVFAALILSTALGLLFVSVIKLIPTTYRS